MQVDAASPHVVLVGGGHAHVQVMLLLASSPPPPRIRVTLISESNVTYYSGMLPGCIAGLYTEKEIQIDLLRFSQWCKVRFYQSRCIALDPFNRQVFTEDGATKYDVISFNVGSMNRGTLVPGVLEHALCTRPISALTAKLQDLQQRLAAAPVPAQRRVVVVGGGAAGVELAFAIHSRLSPCHLTLVTSASDFISERSWWTRKLVASKLQQRGIERLSGHKCVAVTARAAVLDNQTEIPAELVVWATGAAPSPLLAKLRVPLCDQGWIKSVGFANVFAAGDCCTVVGAPGIEKAGVYSVREGPILANNILALIKRTSLVDYSPQSFFLALYSTGDRAAISSYLGTAFSGEWVWQWKNSIDRAFMARFDVSSLGPSHSFLAAHPALEEVQ